MKKRYTIIMLFIIIAGSSFIAASRSFHGWVELQSKVTRFYPNPATTVINFEFDKSINKTYTLQIYNFIGRKMTEVRITESKITINLDDQYLRGLYIYQLRDQGSRIIESGKFQVSK